MSLLFLKFIFDHFQNVPIVQLFSRINKLSIQFNSKFSIFVIIQNWNYFSLDFILFIYQRFTDFWPCSAVTPSRKSLVRQFSRNGAVGGYLVAVTGYTLQYAVKVQRSLAPLSRFRGSHITTAHEQQCCRFQSYAKSVPSPMKLTKREPHSWDPRQRTTWSGLVTSDFNSVLRQLCGCYSVSGWFLEGWLPCTSRNSHADPVICHIDPGTTRDSHMPLPFLENRATWTLRDGSTWRRDCDFSKSCL